MKAWFDNHLVQDELNYSNKVNLLRCAPFIILHLALLLGIFIEFSLSGFVICFVSYFIRMFAITGFYHRYFAHKTFKTSKFIEIFFALLGAASAQRGPIWWAAHHRHHHQTSDTKLDEHSPKTHGFMRSHMLWFMTNKNFHTPDQYVKDLRKKEHLKIIDRFDGVIPLVYLALLGLIGSICRSYTNINLTPLSAMFWGFVVSTVLLFHATFSVNSIAHIFGKKTYQTNDESRNNWLLAIITLGEGWHNNHHHWPVSARQGFNWKQIDISYYCLWFMQKIGLIYDVRNIPLQKINEKKICV